MLLSKTSNTNNIPTFFKIINPIKWITIVMCEIYLSNVKANINISNQIVIKKMINVNI